MLDCEQWTNGHDPELLHEHVAGLLVPGLWVRRETSEIDEHVKGLASVGGGGPLNCAFVQVVNLEYFGACFLQLNRVWVSKEKNIGTQYGSLTSAMLGSASRRVWGRTVPVTSHDSPTNALTRLRPMPRFAPVVGKNTVLRDENKSVLNSPQDFLSAVHTYNQNALGSHCWGCD